MKKLTEKQKEEIIEAAVLLKLLYDTPFSEFTDRTRPIWRKTLGTGWKLWAIIPSPDKFLVEQPVSSQLEKFKVWLLRLVRIGQQVKKEAKKSGRKAVRA